MHFQHINDHLEVAYQFNKQRNINDGKNRVYLLFLFSQRQYDGACMFQICCLQYVSTKFDRVGGPPVLRSTKKPSTSRFKIKIRVFQSQIYKQQVVTWTTTCFFMHGKEKVFLKTLP